MNFGAKFSSCCWLCLCIYLYISLSELMMVSINPAPTAVQMSQKKYILDSSVANMVLDGELWERCPSALVPHKLELQAALFCTSLYKPISSIVLHCHYLPKAINAYSWVKGMQTESPRSLFITPIVALELSRAPQFKQGTWTDMEQLRIKELKGPFRVMASNINLIVTSLTTELEMAILQGKFKNCEQEKEMVSIDSRWSQECK